MNTTKMFRMMALLVLGLFVAFVSPAWAGGPENPPASGTIVGPELWGSITLGCTTLQALTLRVKRVVDCDVETQAFVVPNTWGCPANETTPLNRKLGVTLFGINPDPSVMDPIITKVKNFKQEAGGVYSFDVQIKFWVPQGLMASQEVVTPVKTGVQKIHNGLKQLDSGLRRNDEKRGFSTYYEFITH